MKSDVTKHNNSIVLKTYFTLSLFNVYKTRVVEKQLVLKQGILNQIIILIIKINIYTYHCQTNSPVFSEVRTYMYSDTFTQK